MRPSAAHSRSARRRLSSRCRARIGWASWAASESPAPTGSGSPSRARRRLMASFWWRVTPDSPACGPAVATRTHLQETEQSVNAGWAHVVHRPSRRRARDRALTASGHDMAARVAVIGDNGAMTARRDVILLGSTGSIGTQALDVIMRNPGRFRVVGLARRRRERRPAGRAGDRVRRARRGRRRCLSGSCPGGRAGGPASGGTTPRGPRRPRCSHRARRPRRAMSSSTG